MRIPLLYLSLLLLDSTIQTCLPGPHSSEICGPVLKLDGYSIYHPGRGNYGGLSCPQYQQTLNNIVRPEI